MGVDIVSEVLNYLEKAGPTNTFRLSSVIGIDRVKLLSLLKKLEEKQAIRFEYGNAVFIKFISGENPIKATPKPTEAKEPSFQPQKIAAHRKPAKPKAPKALQLLQTENTQLQLKLSELKETIKELEKKTHAHPRTIMRTVTKTVVKKVPVIKTVVKRIFVHPSPLPAKKEKESTLKKKLKLPPFKLPQFTFMKNIKKLKEPEFVK